MSTKVEMERVCAFLATHELTLQHVLDAVPELPGEKCLIFVGSVPAGTSTSVSDLDLFVIGTTPDSEELIVEQNGIPQVVWTMGESLEVGAAYYPPPIFELLAQKLQRGLSAIGESANLDMPVKKIETLDPSTLNFAHRVKTGVAVRGDIQPIRDHLCLKSLDDYLVSHGVLEHLIYLEDVQGELETGSISSATYTLMIGMGCLGRAVLAAIGETNPYPKWTVRLLERNHKKIGTEIAETLCFYLLGPKDQDPLQWIRDGYKFSSDVIDYCLDLRPAANAVVNGIRKSISHKIDPP